MFFVILLACIYFTEAFIAQGINDRFERNGLRHLCIQGLERCNVQEPNIFILDEDRVFYNLTTTINDELCRLASQMIICMRSISDIPGCLQYVEQVTLPSDVINSLQSNLCHGFGRDDLDSVVRCANNKFIQREFYGKVSETTVYLSEVTQCRFEPGFERLLARKKERDQYICSFIQDIFRALPRLASRYCSPGTSEAVKRVLMILQYLQTDLMRLLPFHLPDECQYINIQ